MSSVIPPPLRAVAGLAAWTLDEARRLPTRLVSLPVLAAGAAMQASLKLQQEYAGLVARGDELLVRFRGRGDDAPAWATFDDDPAAAAAQAPAPESARRREAVAPLLSAADSEPSSFDLVPETTSAHGSGLSSPDVGVAPTVELLDTAAASVAPVPGYDDWTVAQLRARLRRLASDELASLLAYEQEGRQRAPYITMLTNRLAAQSKG